MSRYFSKDRYAFDVSCGSLVHAIVIGHLQSPVRGMHKSKCSYKRVGIISTSMTFIKEGIYFFVFLTIAG
jgi:hypothetical protein